MNIGIDIGGTNLKAGLADDGGRVPAALEVCVRYADYLAAGVTDVINLLQPDILALGGVAAAATCIRRSSGRRRAAARASSARRCWTG